MVLNKKNCILALDFKAILIIIILDPMVYKCVVFLCLFFIGIMPSIAQIELGYVNPAKKWDKDYVMYFTNRTLEKDEEGRVSFNNHTTKQTNSLYFCRYNFDNDSIEVNYQMINKSDSYPNGEIEHNIFYDFYEHQRIGRGIKNYYFVVGGYGKTFEKQVNSYMQRLKNNYGDTLFEKAAIIVFAWGDEDHAYRYWNGVRASKRGAADFAIFQHMLDEFVSDSIYFQTHPNDITISILFSSMGNYMFKEYIDKRKQLGIPLIKTYQNILFLGSVADRKCLEKGETFGHLDQMADSVKLYVNSKDALLWASAIMHLSGRIGRKGPKDISKVPAFVDVKNIDSLIVIGDLPGLGHDYLLTNPQIKASILKNMNSEVEENNTIKPKHK